MNKRRELKDEVYTAMMLAQAKLSKDENTQMGAVLVSKDGRVLSTGYNGAPASFDDSTIPYTRTPQKLAYDLLDADTGAFISHHEFEANKYPFMVHAEINALHYARGKVPEGAKLYVIGFPCERCALDISLAGVSEVFVTKDDYDKNSSLNKSRDTAYYMFAEAGIVITLCGKRLRPVVSMPKLNNLSAEKIWCMTFNEFKDSFIPFCETSKTKTGKAHSYYNAIIHLAEFLNIDKINYENSLIILEKEKHIKDKNNRFYREFLNYLSLRKQSSYLKNGFVRASLPLFHDFIKQQK